MTEMSELVPLAGTPAIGTGQQEITAPGMCSGRSWVKAVTPAPKAPLGSPAAQLSSRVRAKSQQSNYQNNSSSI